MTDKVEPRQSFRPSSEASANDIRLQRAERRLLAIQQISQINAATTDRAELVHAITSRIASLVGCERATLWLIEPAPIHDDPASQDHEVVLVAQLPTQEHLSEVKIPLGRGLAGWVADNNRAINVKDAYKDSRFDAKTDELTGFRTKSVACLPLVDPHPQLTRKGATHPMTPTSTHHGVLGVVQALNKYDDPHPPGDSPSSSGSNGSNGSNGLHGPGSAPPAIGYFSPADEELLRACAEQSAILLRQQRLYADLVTQNYELLDLKFRLQERSAEVELMFDIERAAAVARDLDEALDGALKRTLTEFPCELATLILVERGDARTSFTVRRSAGPREAALPPQVLGLDRLVVECAVHGKTVTRSEWDHHSDGVDAMFSALLGRLDAKVFAAIPVARAGENPLGALLLINPIRVPRGFDEHDLHKLTVIASRIALSVVLATVMEEERKAERLAAIGGALSSVVHDLRTPLTLLSGYARLLSREDDTDKRQELRDLHKRQVEQLQVMIGEILSFAKGQRETFMRKVWVRDILADLEELLRADTAEPTLDSNETAQSRPIALIVHAAYKGAVKADDRKLKRALFNLAKNAREAMAKTGGTLTLTSREDNGRVIFEVSDTGPGIPPEMEGRLFQSFATHGKESGTGLGLAIVKTIVDQHEGTLDVTSSPEGTTFSIALSPA